MRLSFEVQLKHSCNTPKKCDEDRILFLKGTRAMAFRYTILYYHLYAIKTYLQK